MPRSTRDSDDDAKLKIDRVRILAAQTAVNSPSLRRSSRIKQNRSSSASPGSDTSTSNQVLKVTRKRTLTDSSEMSKEQRSRRVSVSSDVSETIDIGTPGKRVTRSSISMSSITTPTKMNTRASKRFVRAGSETNSPSPAVRTTRRTRASSVDPESLDQNKSQPNTPIKIRRRASVLPANSPVKEEIEDNRIPYVRLDVTIFETEENSANSDSSVDKSSQSRKISEKRKSVDKDKVEDKADHDEVTSLPAVSILDKTPELAENNNDNSNNSALKTSNSSLGNLDSSSDKLSNEFSRNENVVRKDVDKNEVKKDKATSSMESQSNEAFNLPENEILDTSNNADSITVDNKENLGDSNCLLDKISQPQTAQKIKTRKSVNKDNVGKNDSFNQSENKNEMRNNNVNKTKKSLDGKQHNSSRDPSDDDSTRITVPSEFSFMDTLHASENNINSELILEKRNPCRDTDEVSSDVITLDRSMKSSTNKETSFNEKSNDQSITKDKQLTQNDVTDNLNLVKEESQKNISKVAEELESSDAVFISNECNSNEALIEGKKLSDFTNIAEGTIVDLLPNLFEKQSIKRNINRRSSIDEASDNLRMKNNSRLEKTQEDQEILNSNSENNINSVSDISADEQKTTKKNNSGNSEIDENNEEDCNLQSMEKEEDNEAEAECDLVLVDKQAWLAAERMKVAKDAESSEYDSDDTMVKKSKLDAARANSDNKILNIIKEEILIDEEIDVFPIETKKLYKMPEQKSEEEMNPLIVCTEDDVSSNGMDKSSDDIKISNSDQNNDCFDYKLNKSEQVANVTRRLSETHRESDEDENDDTDKLNKSSRTNKMNVSQRKSLQERKSLNKSSKNTSLRQNDKNTQDFFTNECQTNDTLQQESDRMEISRKKSLSSKDDNKVREQPYLDRSTEKSKALTSIKLMNVSDKENDSDSDISTIIQVMDLESQNYSTIAHAGSVDGESSDSIIVPEYLFTEDEDDNHNNTDKNSNNDNDSHNNTDKDSDIDSDVRKEYNLDGMEQKFDDDNIPHDECRASESEYSDSNDNGSDLADFIVDDNEVETEEEKGEDSNEEQEENDEEQEEIDDEEQMSDEEREEVSIEEQEEMSDKGQEEMSDEEQEEMNDEEQEEMDYEDKQSEEENNENRKEDNKIDIENKKRKKQNTKKNHRKVEYIPNEDDADNEQSEIEICSYDDSDKSSDEDESSKIIDENKNDSIEIISSCINKAKKEQVVETRRNKKTILSDESNPDVFNENIKPHVVQNEKILSISSESPVKIKRKSFLQNFEKIGTEQDSPKQLDESTNRFSRKFLKLHTSMKCSTPKFNSSKYILEDDIETPKILEETQESKNNVNDENKTMQNTSSKKIKSKDSTMKRDISLTEISHRDKYFVEKPLNISLPSNLLENMKKNRSKPIISKITELYKTISISHTVTPTIRDLRKEKLNETAPASKLYPEIDQSKELPLTIEQKEEIKVKNNEDVANLEPSNDDIVQKHAKQKKRKKQAEETLEKNIIDKALSKDDKETELEILEKKKPVKVSESLETKNDEDTPQINEEKKKKKKTKKKKKKQADINEQSEYIKKADTNQENRNETVLIEHKKNKKTEITNSSESNAPKNDHTNIEKEFERKEQEITQSEKTLPEKSSKKKRKRKQKEKKEAAPLEIKVSKENSKNSNLNKPLSQITGSTIQQDTIVSRNAAFTKARHEVQEAIHAAEMRIRANKELKKKKMQEEIIEKENQKRALQIQKQNLQEQNKSPSKKQKKETSESRAFPSSSTSGLKRLPDDIIKNLSDVPKAVKKRKLLQNEDPITLPSKRSKSMSAKSSLLSTSGGTTQFSVINIQKFKDQPPKELNVVASFRERMFNRNKREPVSAYLMYLEKQRASSNKNKRSKLS